MLLFISMAATLVAIYWFWIHPSLKSRPAFRELYQEEDISSAPYARSLPASSRSSHPRS